MKFTVAIVGCPNVGKSSLFNRILNEKIAIVDEQAVTTKDRLYARVSWLNQVFFIIDTGGFNIDNIVLSEKINQQVKLAIEEANIILFVVNGQIQLSPNDLFISKLLHKSHKKVIVVVNKIDNVNLMSDVYSFYNLGFSDVIGVSAQHGIGIGELLDKIIEFYPRKKIKIVDKPNLKFSLIGRPNVGKSTLTNTLLCQERMIVSNIPGTTTDAVDTFFNYKEQQYQIIDTAGLKRRGQIYEKKAKYSFLRTLSAIERSDIVCFVLDVSQSITEQDRNISSLLFNKKKPCIIICNKWDLIEIKEKYNMQKLEDKIRCEFKFLSYAPILFLSAKEKKRINVFFSMLNQVFSHYKKIFPNHLLNDILNEATQINPPGFFNQGKAKFYYLKQISSSPPVFLCLVNNPKWIHFSYERFLKNQLQLHLELTGIPVKIIFKKKEDIFL
ncbi:MAG: ribosome biogenesis GTPase Der [Vigna little leaf phytoplasma]|nr:ribosome biogenesis GTPase Der [Vigna little leaf phytoplasma]